MWTEVKSNYGYGWMVRKRYDRKMIMHTGGLPGCNTIVCRYPDQHVFVGRRLRQPAGKERDDRLHQQSRRIGIGQSDALRGAQATVAARAFVEAVGEGEGVAFPGEERTAGCRCGQPRPLLSGLSPRPLACFRDSAEFIPYPS